MPVEQRCQVSAAKPTQYHLKTRPKPVDIQRGNFQSVFLVFSAAVLLQCLRPAPFSVCARNSSTCGFGFEDFSLNIELFVKTYCPKEVLATSGKCRKRMLHCVIIFRFHLEYLQKILCKRNTCKQKQTFFYI